MSADNGIYILPVELGHEKRYFVSERAAIDNLYYEGTGFNGYNLDEVSAFIDDSTSFPTLDEAEIFANSLENKLDFPTEYGVVVLNLFRY